MPEARLTQSNIASDMPTTSRSQSESGVPRGQREEGQREESPLRKAPEGFTSQSHGWYKSGRFFSIWAPKDEEIHEKKLILLHTNNKEGMGVLVETLVGEKRIRQVTETSDAYDTHLKLEADKTDEAAPGTQYATSKGLSSSKQRKAMKTAHVENLDEELDPHTYLCLAVMYNVPFAKYECKDHGNLSQKSLKELRLHYARYLLRTQWGVWEDFLHANSLTLKSG